MKTDQQILERIKAIESRDIFGFERNDLIVYLSFKAAKPFLKKGLTASDWQEFSQELSVIKEVIFKYMKFAWEKANNCRSLSANRSIMHFMAWTWIVDEEFCKEIEKEYDENYQYYGKDILAKICTHFSIDYKQWDDGVRSNTEY